MEQAFTLDKELIESAKFGNRQAQYSLYDSYKKAMYNTCLRMVDDQGDAEDILQEAFISAFTKLGSFHYESTFGAWLKRIVINKCLNHLQRKRIDVQSIDQLPEIDEQDNDEEEFEYSVEMVRRAVYKLPKGYKVIISLYLFEGYDHSEISEVLGISASTSKSQYHRAKKKLIEIIKKNSHE